MRWQQFIIEIYKSMSRELEQILDGLTVEDLHKLPASGTNPILSRPP